MIADVFLAACAVAAVLLGLYVPKMRQQWRNARGVIELTQREHACETCSDPAGMGPCSCAARCGHRLCRGRRMQARWNADDFRWAHDTGIDLERSVKP